QGATVEKGSALAAMRAAPTADPSGEDPAEAAIRAYRVKHPTCDKCGIRPEPDAIYCSSCGSYLPGRCGSCGVAVTEAGVRYCIACGARLSARSSPASTSRS
ncbi:MAG TPA: zinc ribbon domain-containing protein, partial [Gemmatimonadaceae bacterium]|nr:zinc ribbon domain-containing protein [Gemmatimonadaceae bacterium]